MNPDLFAFKLAGGAHRNPQAGTCFMEAVAWMAREPHSDRPECACLVLGIFGIRINDRMTDAERVGLNPLILKMMNTRSKAHEELRAAHLLQGVATRILAPIFDARGWTEIAALVRTIPKGATRAEMVATLCQAKEAAYQKRVDASAAAAALAASAGAYAYAAASDAAAGAYAYAAGGAFASRALWVREVIAILNEAIELGPHNGDELYAVPALQQRIAEFRGLVAA